MRTDNQHVESLPQFPSNTIFLQQVDPLLKLSDVIGDRKRGIAGLIPMSRAKWYLGIQKKIFPAPLHIGSGSFWRRSTILAIIDRAEGEQ